MRGLALIAGFGFAASGVVAGATLQPYTCGAWDEYINSATAQMAQRLDREASFLWIDEVPQRSERVKAGEIVVAPVGARNPKKVPAGLIHDWIGAVFIPQATLEDVLLVSRDYDNYKDWYRPAVADSKLLDIQEDRYRYSMLLMNRALLVRTAYDTEYEASYVRVDAHRAYSIARSIRVQEIENYDSAAQGLLPEGTGRGIIWRLFCITRYLERDGGVYVEFQATGLSRDIPSSVRWFVEPMVRRLARSSLLGSLRQTEEAVQSRREVASHNPH